MSDAAALTAEDLAAHGRETIARGSKSFAAASLLFDRGMQADVQMLYAWCRYCDDAIDGQDLGGDAPDAGLSSEEQHRRLDRLKRDTRRALAGERVGHAAFDGFSIVARKASLPADYPMHLLDGFAMDAAGRRYETIDHTLEYCYGVAGSVGVMMAIVMGVDPDDSETLDRACDLGLAFQLTNICRDVVDDAAAGRVYLPASALAEEGIAATSDAVRHPDNRAALARAVDSVLALADRHYASASEGLRRLPPRAAAAIAAARNVYRDIGEIVRKRGADAWAQRAYTSNARKTWLVLTGLAAGAPQPLLMSRREMKSRGELWRRPG